LFTGIFGAVGTMVEVQRSRLGNAKEDQPFQPAQRSATWGQRKTRSAICC